jgi:hypothetical protein
VPDTKTWEGVGHEEKTSYGRRMDGREERAGTGRGGRQHEQVRDEEQEDEQS